MELLISGFGGDFFKKAVKSLVSAERLAQKWVMGDGEQGYGRRRGQSASRQ